MTAAQVSELQAGLTGLQQLEAFLAAGVQPPMGATLGIALVEVGEGFAAFEGTPEARFYNPLGTVHAAYATALLDSACGCAVHSVLAADQAYTTLEIKVAFHKALTRETGKVRAEGRVLSVGRRTAFGEARLHDASGRLLASATSSLLVMTP